MTDPIDTWKLGQQQTLPDATLDARRGKPDTPQLHMRNHPVLPAGDTRHLPLKRPGMRSHSDSNPGRFKDSPPSNPIFIAIRSPVNRTRGYLGLGSNQGDRAANLRSARTALERRGIAVTASSSLYETEPQGEITDQPDFLNAALAIETELPLEELLEACKQVEAELGRDFDQPRHSPRPVDVDVLLLGDQEYSSPRLTIPHRDVLTRRFVLAPLLELEPHLALPDGTRLQDALDRLEGQRVERVGAF